MIYFARPETPYRQSTRSGEQKKKYRVAYTS